MTSYQLDRSDPAPLHHQLASAIEAAIHDGRLAAGARVQPEVETPRGTRHRPANRARRHGQPGPSGPCWSDPRLWDPCRENPGPPSTWSPDQHTDYEYQSQSALATVVLVNELIDAPDTVTSALRIGPHGKVLHLRRLRLHDGEPLAISRTTCRVIFPPLGSTTSPALASTPRSNEPGYVRGSQPNRSVHGWAPTKNAACCTNRLRPSCSQGDEPPTTTPAGPSTSSTTLSVPAATPTT